MPHSDKHYRKLLQTYKFVVYMVLAALFVLGAGLSLMWLFDRVGDSFMSRGWQVFFIIVFALLVAGLQIPGYIMDIRKIDMDNPSPAQPQKPKPYAAILEQARKEDLLAEDLQELIDLQAQHKTVRQIAEETGFAPTTVHRKLKKAEQLGYKPSSGTQCPVPSSLWNGTRYKQELPPP